MHPYCFSSPVSHPSGNFAKGDGLVAIRLVQTADGPVRQHGQVAVGAAALVEPPGYRPGLALIVTGADGQIVPPAAAGHCVCPIWFASGPALRVGTDHANDLPPPLIPFATRGANLTCTPFGRRGSPGRPARVGSRPSRFNLSGAPGYDGKDGPTAHGVALLRYRELHGTERGHTGRACCFGPSRQGRLRCVPPGLPRLEGC